MRVVTTAAAAALTLFAITPVAAQDLGSGDAESGKKLFVRCGACHAVGDGAQAKVGPVLNNVFGSQPGTSDSFNRYSPAMKTFGEGKVWTPELVAQFIENPRKLVAGTMMAFPGLRRPQDQADVITYLAQYDDEGTAVEQTAAK